MQEHLKRVQSIQHAVQQQAAEKGKVSLKKEGVSHFVPDAHAKSVSKSRIDVSTLKHILHIDKESLTCEAEPGVTFAQLVDETLKVGLVPKLVPELQTITLGGAVAGCSVESMSFRYGGFHDSCRSYEIIRSNGERIECNRSQNTALFEMIHGSYGTLGILSKLTFDLIAAENFVCIDYLHFDSYEPFQRKLYELTHSDSTQMVDAIAHSANHLVISLAHFTKFAPWVSDYTRDQIYYRSTIHKRRDYLTTRDYFFRYDTECHWLTKTIPGLENKWIRKLVAPYVLGSTNLITWSDRLKPVLKFQKRPPIVIDVFIPTARMEEFFQWYVRAFDYYPLWMVPYRTPYVYPWLSKEHAERMAGNEFIDCAIYGKPNDIPGVDFSKILEEKVYELGGIKTLISRNHYSKERFWSIYNEPLYRKVKSQADPNQIFPDVYEKMGQRGSI